jgi:hypothetical protein
VNSRALSAVVARYGRGTRIVRPPLGAPLTAEALDVLEAADSDAPAAAVAARLASIAAWQDRIEGLAAADTEGALSAYLDAERAACTAAHAAVNDAFVRWYFDGWAVLPAVLTGETVR